MDTSTWTDGDVAVADGMTCFATLARAHLVEAGTSTSTVQMYNSDGALDPQVHRVNARRVFTAQQATGIDGWLNAARTIAQFTQEQSAYVPAAEMHAAWQVQRLATGQEAHRVVYGPRGFRDCVDFVVIRTVGDFEKLLSAGKLERSELVEPFIEHDARVFMTHAVHRQLGRAVAERSPSAALALEPRGYTSQGDEIADVLETWCLPHLPGLAEAKDRLDRAERELREAQVLYDTLRCKHG